MGPSNRGIYAVILQSVNIFIALGQFGLIDVMLSQTKGQNLKFEILAGNSLFFILLSTIFIALGLLISYFLFSNIIYNNVTIRLLFFGFLFAPFNLIITFFNRIIQLSGKIILYNKVTFLLQIFWLINISIWLIFWKNSLEAVLFGLATSQFILAIYCIYLVKKNIASDRWHIDKKLFSQSLKDGSKMSIGIFSAILGQQIGIFIINYYMKPEQVGWYAIALGLSTMIFLLSRSIRTVLQSWIGSVNKTESEIAEQTIITSRYFLICSILVCLMVILFGKIIISIIYGSAYLPAYSPLVILLFFVILRGIDQIISSYLTYIKHFLTLSIASTIGMISTLIMSIYFAQTIGINGVAIATVTGQFFAVSIVGFIFFKNTNFAIYDLVPKKNDFYYFGNQIINIIKKR